MHRALASLILTVINGCTQHDSHLPAQGLYLIVSALLPLIGVESELASRDKGHKSLGRGRFLKKPQLRTKKSNCTPVVLVPFNTPSLQRYHQSNSYKHRTIACKRHATYTAEASEIDVLATRNVTATKSRTPASCVVFMDALVTFVTNSTSCSVGTTVTNIYTEG